LKLKKPIEWRIIEGKDDRIISQTLLAPTPPDDPSAKPKFGQSMALIALDGQRRVFLRFTAQTENADERYAFMAMAEKILASIVSLPPEK
jgi:hypothetical protein